jgi:ribosomal protein S8
MNRHFFNFIAMFNAAAKTRKLSFSIPLRNGFIVTYLNFLHKAGLIEGYSFESNGGVSPFESIKVKGRHVRLGKKASNYYVPVRVYNKPGLIKKIVSVSTPGKYFFFSKKEMQHYIKVKTGAKGLVIVSSSHFKRLCDGREVVAAGQGGLVLSVVLF